MVVALRQDVTVRAKEMTITPRMAEDWLRKTAPNRRISDAAVSRYAEDMRRGRWESNGSTIVMGQSGKILDGQHRLTAIIRAGVPVNMVVVSGVEDSAFKTIDTGRSRSVADVLKVMGFASSNNLAATAKQWLVYERFGQFSESLGKEFTAQETIACAIENSELFGEAINGCSGAYRLLRGSHSVWAVLWIKFGEIDALDRDSFFAGLAEGIQLRDDSPIYALRRYMLEHRRSRERGLSVLPAMLGALAIKAWNRYRNHEPTRQLAWRANESYPAPQ